MGKRVLLAVVVSLAAISGSVAAKNESSAKRPNFLICISDDQSYWHTSFHGDPVVKTPTFDRIAREGAVFTRMYCNSPSCAPSRGAMLTGRNIYELEEASILAGSFPAKFQTYQEILWDNGYYTGYVGKGSPGTWMADADRRFCPGGMPYRASFKKRDEKKKGRSATGNTDCVGSFRDFLRDRHSGQPFSFIFASSDPHRPYDVGSGVKSGMDISKVKVPGFMPDTPGIRSDLCDYLLEIQKFDRELGEMLKILEDAGELDNTFVLVTSDNGMPFPGAAKCNLYDPGTRMPFAVRYPPMVDAGRRIDDLTTLAEICPTILETAGIDIPSEVSVKSLTNLLKSKKSGRIDPSREFIVTAMEYHGGPKPMRMIRTHEHMYIINCQPGLKVSDAFEEKPTAPSSALLTEGRNYPLRQYLVAFRKEPEVSKYFEAAFGPRPAEELFDCEKDPCQRRNLADDPQMKEKKVALRNQLLAYLKKTGDPRYTDAPVLFESYVFNDWKKAHPELTEKELQRRKDEIFKAMRRQQAEREGN